jgi:hypothetical protein
VGKHDTRGGSRCKTRRQPRRHRASVIDRPIRTSCKPLNGVVSAPTGVGVSWRWLVIQSIQRCSTLGPALVASGKPPMAGHTGKTSRMAFSGPRRSVPSPSPTPIPMSSMPAWANAASAAMSPRVTASTSQPMWEKPGFTWGWRRRATSHGCAFIRRIPVCPQDSKAASAWRCRRPNLTCQRHASRFRGPVRPAHTHS